MIVIRLWGGLGNQMFQYAFGYAQARKRNTELLLDTRFFTEKFLMQNPRFSQQKLNLLNMPITFREQINQQNELSFVNMLQSKNVNRILRLLPRFSVPVGQMKYVKETRLEYLPYIDSIKSKNLYFDGYWQSEAYFEAYKEQLVQQFIHMTPDAVRYVNEHVYTETNSVSLHMRLGDYSKKKTYSRQINSVLKPTYYMDAISWMKQHVDHPRFFIFTNDKKKAKEILGEKDYFVYVNEDGSMSDMDEFHIMSCCTNHIISNSTFSWWAAWLAQSDGITLVPNVFFGNQDIIPTRWIKLDVAD